MHINRRFKSPNLAGFVPSLAACNVVLCTNWQQRFFSFDFLYEQIKTFDMSEFITVNVFADSKRIRVKCKKHVENSYFEFQGFVFLIKRRKTALHRH